MSKYKVLYNKLRVMWTMLQKNYKKFLLQRQYIIFFGICLFIEEKIKLRKEELVKEEKIKFKKRKIKLRKENFK